MTRAAPRTEIGKGGTEAAHVKRVKANGGVSRKLAWPGRRHAPDRLDLYGLAKAAQIVREHYHCIVPNCSDCLGFARRIVDAAIQFTETKAPGKKPRAGQLREHARLRAMGFRVNVVDR